MKRRTKGKGKHSSVRFAKREEQAGVKPEGKAEKRNSSVDELLQQIEQREAQEREQSNANQGLDAEQVSSAIENIQRTEATLPAELPSEISELAAEHVAEHSNQELLSKHQRYSRMLDFHKQIYPEVSNIKEIAGAPPDFAAAAAAIASPLTPSPEWDRQFIKANQEALQAAIRLLANEIIRRGLVPEEGNGAAEPWHESDLASRSGANDDPEVAKRRSLARANRSVPAEEMCEIFDREHVPLPLRWQGAGFSSWVKAYENSNYRDRIDVLISKDKRHS
jgi:hypothetical protein